VALFFVVRYYSWPLSLLCLLSKLIMHGALNLWIHSFLRLNDLAQEKKVTIIILLQSHVSDVACVNWMRRKHGRARWQWVASEVRVLQAEAVRQLCCHPPQRRVVHHCSEHYCALQWRWLKNRTVVNVWILSNGLRNVRPEFDSRHWHPFVYLKCPFLGPISRGSFLRLKIGWRG
jgi:hypothetical protein